MKLTCFRKELGLQVPSRKKGRWRRSKEGYNLSEMSVTAVCRMFWVMASKQRLTLESVPDLQVKK
jgi:hypothetical protein